ncbi:hypothetical protein CsSME_00001164 [Camellia sinensis var. sinensis]
MRGNFTSMQPTDATKQPENRTPGTILQVVLCPSVVSMDIYYKGDSMLSQEATATIAASTASLFYLQD